jgi:hypothetical protein
MRVHPTALSSNGRWQVPLVLLLAALTVVASLTSPREPSADATHDEHIPQKAAIVVKISLPAGKEITKEDLRIEQRPIYTLPADAVAEISEALGKTTAGPIPAGYPLARTLLLNKEDIKEETKTDSPPASAEAPLAQIPSEMVPFLAAFTTPVPDPGSRIALCIQGTRRSFVLVAEEAWVEEASSNVARLRVHPGSPLFLEQTKIFGDFSYLIIPKDGPSPFAGQAINNISDLELKLKQEPQIPRQSGRAATEGQALPANYASFAWITGSSMTYGINADGQIALSSKNGKATLLSGGKTKRKIKQ